MVWTYDRRNLSSGKSVLQAIQDLFERNIWQGGAAPASQPGHGLAREHLWVTHTSKSPSAYIRSAAIDHRDSACLHWPLQHPDLCIRNHIESRGPGGANALWSAVHEGHASHVEMLLTHGARVDVQIQDQLGQHLLDFAESHAMSDPNRQSILASLRAHQAARQALKSVDDLFHARGVRP